MPGGEGVAGNGEGTGKRWVAQGHLTWHRHISRLSVARKKLLVEDGSDQRQRGLWALCDSKPLVFKALVPARVVGAVSSPESSGRQGCVSWPCFSPSL